MAGILPIISRTSTALNSQTVLSRLRETQTRLFETQDSISTGRAINRPSDAAGKVSSVLYLNNRLSERDQELRNLTAAGNYLDFADTGLGEGKSLLDQAKSTALSQIGVGSDAKTREAQALVADSYIDGLLEIGNRQFNQLSVFGGNNGAAPGQRVFEEFLGGVRYVGGTGNLQAQVGAFGDEDFTSNGLSAFGALSARVKGTANLAPTTTAATALSTLGGALNKGVLKGAIDVTINATKVSVDLNSADSMGDVVTRVNDAINAVVPGGGSLAITGNGFSLTGNGGNTVSIADATGGQTALSLGLTGLSSTGGVPSAGAGVNVKLTPTTTLASLGTAVDFASGLVINQGAETRTVDLSTATTVQDLQNTIKGLNLGLRLDINSAGTGFDIVSEVAGLELSIGENGGTTASDLGLRTFDLTTELSSFRNDVGVIAQPGKDDLRVKLHDGRTFNVNLDTATTVGDTITLIQSAATAAGVNAADFNVSLATMGNGLVFNDTTAGGFDFIVEQINESHAAEHLGLGTQSNAGAAGTINGADVAKVRVENLFTHLIDLRDSLAGNDERGITLAGEKLEGDIEAITAARATVGTQAKRLIDVESRAQDQQETEETMLSDLRDTDLTEAITRYQQLQLQLQASLQVGAQQLQTSLLDFLR